MHVGLAIGIAKLALGGPGRRPVLVLFYKMEAFL
jgi:hypothetical protein